MKEFGLNHWHEEKKGGKEQHLGGFMKIERKLMEGREKPVHQLSYNAKRWRYTGGLGRKWWENISDLY